MKPRPYQQHAIDQIKREFATGCRRLLLQLATGGGKTFIFSTILQGAHNKGNPCVMAVRGRSLVDQASRRLTEMGVPHGVFMANDKRNNPDEKIQIVSIDTVRARKLAPEAKILVIDEAHFATSKSFKDFLEFYPDAYWLSVTATPWVKGGLKHLADKIIYPISIEDLTNQGYLVPAKYFVPTDFDDKNIKVKNGEFDEESALVQFEKQSVYGDVMASYKSKCLGEPTFCFAINISHANTLRQYFEDNNFIAVVITADTSLVEREYILNEFQLGRVHVVISIGTMTTGVDVPALKNIILCRPTHSKNLYIQMLGRGTRPHENKDHFKVIDHVGNVARHGFMIDERIADLEGYKSKKDLKSEPKAPYKKCPACFRVCKIHDAVCPSCQHVFIKPPEIPAQINSELKELELDVPSRMRLRAKYLVHHAWEMGYKIGYVYIKLKEEFGEDSMRKYYHSYRWAKSLYESWQHGTTPAPCAWGASKNRFSSVGACLEADYGSSFQAEYGD